MYKESVMKRVLNLIVSLCLVTTLVFTSFGMLKKQEVKAYTVNVNIVNGGDDALKNAMKNTTYKVNNVTYNNYSRYEGVSATSDSEVRSASGAIDGNLGSRWESEHGVDGVYLQVDLGNTYAVKMIGIYWEYASAKKYTLKGSADGKNYSDIKLVESTNRERTDLLTLSDVQNYRFLEVVCSERNTSYGNSIYELAVFGTESQKELLPVVSNLNVTDYSKWTGKYLLYFNEAKGAEGYRIYIDDETEPLKTVGGSGAYLTNTELSKYSDGSHKITVSSLYTEDGETKETSSAEKTFTKSSAEGSFTDIPQIYIKSGSISSEYREKADVSVTVVDQNGGSNGLANVDDSGSHKDAKKITTYKDIIDTTSNIKIRGNTTASQPKKAWNIKLNKKQSILGMPKGKKWCLLANAMDKSLMRDTLSYNFGLENGVKYTSQSRYADVYLNGEFMGNYQVCEPVEAKTDRVDINAYDAESNDILLEYGTRNEEGVDHFNTNIYNTTFDVNDPEKGDDLTDEQVDAKILRVKNYLNGFEDILRTDVNNTDAISNYIDIDSFVDYYIANELFKNVDFNYSSTRFYIKDGKIYAGPMWDLDLSSGNCKSSYYTSYYVDGDSSKGFYCRGIKWYDRLFKNQTFQEKVIARYYNLQYKIQSLYRSDSTEVNSIEYLIDRYGSSFERNYVSKDLNGAGWSIRHNDGYSFAAESSWETWNDPIEFLRDWLTRRNVWLSEQWGVDMDEAYARGKAEAETTTPEPTTTVKPTTTTVSTTAVPTTTPIVTTKTVSTSLEPTTVIPATDNTTKSDTTDRVTKGKQVKKTTTKNGKTNMKKPGKTKVKKAVRKSPKKIKVTLKKVKRASGYQVAIYKNKKKAKKNRKYIVRKLVKKCKFKIKSKRFRKYKKLFVRARAYRKYGTAKKFGAWSKVKKVK